MYMLFKEKETKFSWLSALKSSPRAAPRGVGEEGAGDRDYRGLSTPTPSCSLSHFSQTFQLLHQLTDDRMKSSHVTSSHTTNINGCLL